MIPKINSKSRTGDVSATSTSILKDFSKRDFTADAYMKSMVRKLSKNNKLMTAALKEKAARSILAPIDKKRDKILRVLFHEVSTKELWPDPIVSNAATHVAKELDKYGYETVDMAYAIESAHINALLKDFEKSDVAKEITRLPGFGGLVRQLEVVQKEFEIAYLKFVDLKIEKKKFDSATKLKFIICKLINNEVLVHLNAKANSHPDQYKDCAEVIKVIIENNNSKVRNRRSKVGKGRSVV